MDQQALGTLGFWVLLLGLAAIALAPVIVQVLRAACRRRTNPTDFHFTRVQRDESGLDDGLTEYRDKAGDQ